MTPRRAQIMARDRGRVHHEQDIIAAERVGTALELALEPDVVLIAERHRFTQASRGCPDEALVGTRSRRRRKHSHREGRLPAELLNDAQCPIA